ncbi:Beta-lactamase domain-containing protein [Fusarium sp. LHS14.1]|nr:Beta-lactamase domain-containing protein [Fusarium sp. LHS14.1]
MRTIHLLYLLFSAGVQLPTSLAAEETANPYVNPETLGTFNISSLNSSDPRYSAFLTRQEAERLPNRTTQVRHGSGLREMTIGRELDFTTKANGTEHGIDCFMYYFGISGVMIVKDGAIRLERYHTILGVAVKQGKVKMQDRASKYIPELTGFPFGAVPLEALSDMTSGLAEPTGPDAPDLFADVYYRTNADAVLDYTKNFTKVANPGKVFLYADINYYVLSFALQRALGEPIEDLVTKYIWDPAGMKYDGYMRTSAAHQVDGHGGLAITLQDMARFGLFILDNLNGVGGPKVPRGWFNAIAAGSTNTGVRAPGAIAVVPASGYQTGWWTMPRGGKKYQLGDDDGFAALGTYDQAIYVIPKMNMTVALQSSFPVHYPDLFYYGQQFVRSASLALKRKY